VQCSYNNYIGIDVLAVSPYHIIVYICTTIYDKIKYWTMWSIIKTWQFKFANNLGQIPIT